MLRIEILRSRITYSALILSLLFSFVNCSPSAEQHSVPGIDTDARATSTELNSAAADSVNDPVSEARTSASPDRKIEVRTFQNESGISGFGYDILMDGSVKIHQPNVPAVQGNNGFSSEAKARKAGEFAAQKVRKNMMPPSVNAKELDSLGVLN